MPRKELAIQNRIELAIGSLPDVLTLRNSVGVAKHVDRNGKEWTVPYGLGVGSPDLLCIVAPLGRLVALEVKDPGGVVSDEQRRCHAAWRRFGIVVGVVYSPEDALAVLATVRGRP